jgi:hypothetical protein
LNLDEDFIKYKNITLTIIEIVKAENYENLDELFNQRQLILDNINKINYSKEDLREFYVKYNIEKLDKIIEEEIKKGKEELLVRMKQSQKRRIAMNGYNNLQAKAVFLSGKF